MKHITIGKLRGLQQISTRRGTITALALDHRQNLRKANPAFVEDEELSRFKLDVTTALAKRATAVLLDPEGLCGTGSCPACDSGQRWAGRRPQSLLDTQVR